jgi:phosphatidylinositol dimannoside acyltransferase
VGDLRARLTYLIYRALGWVLQLLPESVAGVAAAAVGEVMARRRTGPAELRAHHLERLLASASPLVAPDPGVVDRWARRSFGAYARYWVEGARLPATGRGEVGQRMFVERGWDHLVEAMAAGRGVVLALPHVGSWEWGGAWLASVGYPMTSVAERIEPPALFEWFLEERRAMGLTILPLGGDSGGALIKTLRSGGLVGLLCDRDIAGGGIEAEFFGEATTFPAGPATLALRTGATLLVGAVYSGPGRDHVGVITAPIDTTRHGAMRADVTRVTRLVVAELERLIRRSPEQWHLYQANWPSDPPPAGSGS